MTFSQNILVRYQKFIMVLVTIIFIAAVILLQNGHEAVYWLQYWWLFPIALIIAVVVNTAGVSGASLFVPFFILLFPILSGRTLAGIESVKLGLITESFGLSSSALAFVAYGLTDKKIALKTVLFAAPFVIAGAIVSSYIPNVILFLILASLLIISVVFLATERQIKERQKFEQRGDKSLIDVRTPHGEQITLASKDGKTYRYCRTKEGAHKRLIGYSIGGFAQGSAGFGIGELGIVSMILSGVPTRIAIGTSHIIVAITAISASLTHVMLASAFNESISWNIPIITVPAVILGGQIAPFVAAKLPNKLLVRFISALFIAIAGSLVILAFKS